MNSTSIAHACSSVSDIEPYRLQERVRGAKFDMGVTISGSRTRGLRRGMFDRFYCGYSRREYIMMQVFIQTGLVMMSTITMTATVNSKWRQSEKSEKYAVLRRPIFQPLGFRIDPIHALSSPFAPSRAL